MGRSLAPPVRILLFLIAFIGGSSKARPMSLTQPSRTYWPVNATLEGGRPATQACWKAAARQGGGAGGRQAPEGSEAAEITRRPSLTSTSSGVPTSKPASASQ